MDETVKNIFDSMRKKSWKREVATAMLLAVLCMGVFVLGGDNGDLMEARGRILDLFVYPIFLFAGAAFGFQAFTDQYVPKKAQSRRAEKLPPTMEELAMLTPPADPQDSVTLVPPANVVAAKDAPTPPSGSD